ncbi:hypothetical protein QBC35DRAFT_384428 [Podospora australis]|uniref:C2H2-type domain-containing protein n=1 Tax=Podospora australis TaxID=1536484 RepID=A0AAN6WWB4_9PEZI|nr:hypothetical protein QBC35DRAFT_384428 [Podospora australis]
MSFSEHDVPYDPQQQQQQYIYSQEQDHSSNTYPIDPTFYNNSQAEAHDSNPYDPTYASSSSFTQQNETTHPLPFHCPICGPDKRYKRQCDLDKHLHNHTKRRQCPFTNCTWPGGAETKDLNRHLWTNHRDYAQQNDIKREEKPCGFPGCNYYGRKDNLKRHRDTKGHWLDH